MKYKSKSYLKLYKFLRINLFVIVLFTLISGCTAIQPWERDLLADPAMALISDPLEMGIDEHIYFSKEGSSGGRGFSGGGCGCN